MSTDARPAKRPRADGLETATPITRSPEYWFEDGSIVLQVESTQFRVAKTLLARHSSVFADMLSLPLPSDEPLVEGCPVVVLPDSSADWKHLLDVLYPKCGLSDPNEVPTFDQVAAILRLSKKYDIPELRRRCIARLRQEIPTTLVEYDKPVNRLFGIDIPLRDITFYVNVVKLAREIGLLSLLPNAYYHINALPPEKGIEHEYFQNLDVADQLTVFRGRARCYGLFVQSPWQWISPIPDRVPCGSCVQTQTCATAFAASQNTVLKHNHILLGVLRPLSQVIGPGKLFCEPCTASLQPIHDGARTACWDALPSYFGLPPWEELLKMDFE